ncbi:DUF3053 family protein [Clostridium beijerinckii]|uniref:Uncharacterized membrane protein (DUF485 family) n=1 Tax=Clostridium beijerinckii TaxID=1520 RepID=A0AAX0ATG9_CLOBE|nr:DUF3053 family protein [Clostridium beijerinckii]NRT86365.1 uncharacterized membrane protein (DUF485 family) [Clostridium beijerinckii]NYC71797.1 uncharacterized membrane protein (DUF485 family) [Clostridium beijerinckii]
MSDLENYNNANLSENQNLEFKVNKNESKKGFLFILSIVFFALGLLLSCIKAFINFRDSSYYVNTSYALGYATTTIVISLVVIAALFLLSTRVFDKKGLLLIFSIIYLLGSFSSTGAAIVQNSLKESKLNKAAKDKFISMYNTAVNEKEISEENFDKSVYGHMTPFLSLTNDYFIKFQKHANDISKDIDSLELDKTLSASALGSTEEINNSKKKIADCRKIFDKHETEYNDLIVNFTTSASTLELPKSFKSDMLEGFKKSQNETREKITDFLKVERDILTNIDNILDFMLSVQGKYVVKNDKILFETEADLNKYNEYIKELQTLAQKETDLKKNIYDSQKLKLNEFNNNK